MGNKPGTIDIKLQNLTIKFKIMKTTDRTARGNFEELISQFSKDEILSEFAMQSVKGGDGDGGGDLIIIPKPPQGGGN